MKRIAHIIVASLLSFMIVWMGVGVAVVHCMHTGRVMAVSEMSAPTHCDGPMKMPAHCMQLQVHKLSAQQAPSFSFDFHAFQPLVAVLPKALSLGFASVRRALPEVLPYVWHSPPRAYLSLLRILIL